MAPRSLQAPNRKRAFGSRRHWPCSLPDQSPPASSGRVSKSCLLPFPLHFHAGHRRIDEGYEVTENIGHFRQQSSIDAASRSEVTTASGDLGSQMLFDESRHALQGASRGASAGSLMSLPLLGPPETEGERGRERMRTRRKPPLLLFPLVSLSALAAQSKTSLRCELD